MMTPQIETPQPRIRRPSARDVMRFGGASAAAAAAGAKRRAGAGGGGIDPGTVATRTLILRENVGITGDPCSAWADQSGAGNDFSQGTGGLQPDVLASPLGALQFDGSDDYLSGVSIASLFSNSGYTVYLVGTLDGAPAGSSKDYTADGFCGTDEAANWGIHVYDNSGTYRVFCNHYDGGSQYVGNRALSLSTLYCIRVRHDDAGTTLYVRANGGEESATVGEISLSGTMVLGKAYSTSNLPITLRYVAMFSSHLDGTTRDGIDTWLQAQFAGITL